jgi:hypothetical protein
MANIRTSLTVTAPGGQKLTASINKEANATVDREIVLNSGEFAEVFNMDTESPLAIANPIGNSLSDYKQLIAYNSGAAPLEVALKTALYDDDGQTHAELYGYPVFFVPVGGYVSLPSPRMITLSGGSGGVSTTPEAQNYITDAGNKCVAQLNLRLFESTATYVSLDGKTKKTGLSAAGVTNGNGDLYLTSVHDKDVSSSESDNSGSSKTAATSIVPGSIRLQFYDPAYQEYNYTGNGLQAQQSASSTLLTAATAYAFNLGMNGASVSQITFTTDATDVTWGSSLTGNGVLAKIQAAMDAAEKECDVAIVDGNLRFTSRNRDTLNSAVLIQGPTSGTDFRESGINAASFIVTTACVVSDVNDDAMMYDDGEGNLSRANGGSGWCRYGWPASAGTRAGLYITGAPAYSSVKVSWLHTSGSGGNLSASTPVNDEEKCNSLLSVYARCLGYATDKGADGRKGKLRLIVVDNADINTDSY